MAGLVNPAQSQGGAFRAMPSELAAKLAGVIAAPANAVNTMIDLGRRGMQNDLLDERGDAQPGVADEAFMAALDTMGLGGAVESGGMVAGSGMRRMSRRGAYIDEASAPAGAPVDAPGFAGDGRALRMGDNQGPSLHGEQYPETGPGVVKWDKKKKQEYLSKQRTPEEDLLHQRREAIMKDMKENGYQPYFDVSKRSRVDPSNYEFSDLDPGPATIAAATDAKREKGYAQSFDDDALDRLRAGYDRSKGDELAGNWYAAKQMEDEFIKRLGPEAGRKAFSDKLRGIAVTTAGLDPTTNILLAHYADFYKAQHPGEEIPKMGYELPTPIKGGKYGASQNIANYEKQGDRELDPFVKPKGYSFRGNFLGRDDLATIDDQISQALPGKPSQPELYGATQEAVEHLAAENGVSPMDFQDVTWAGLKKTQGKPMVSHWNDMIERTSRITGLPHEKVLDHYIHNTGPMYSGGPGTSGMTAVTNALMGIQDPQQQPVDPRKIYGDRGA